VNRCVFADGIVHTLDMLRNSAEGAARREPRLKKLLADSMPGGAEGLLTKMVGSAAKREAVAYMRNVVRLAYCCRPQYGPLPLAPAF
jgi:hypothetical protein